MFPDGSGVDFDPMAETYGASKGAGGAPSAMPGGGPTITADPPAPTSGGGWPEGLAPQSVEASGLPAYLTNPSGFVKPPDQVSPDGEPSLLAASGAPRGSADVEARLRAQLQAPVAPTEDLRLAEPGPTKLKCPKCGTVNLASAKACKNCGHDLAEARKAKFANMSAAPEPKIMLFGTGIPLQLSARADDSGLVWKVACKTGTLALSPGPGQIDMDVPLELTPELFDDVMEGFEQKAFPYVTVPETHGNGSLENTGYVKALEKLSKAELMADGRVTPEGKAHVKDDPEDTEYLLTGILFTDQKAKAKAQDGSIPDVSVGIKSNWREKAGGKTFRHALEHLALTPVPWHPGLIPFNPAVALGAQPFDQAEPDGDVVWYTEPDLRLAMRIEHSGDDFDAAAARASILALGPGDSLSWNYDVRVERVASGDGDGTYYLVRAPQSDDPDDYGAYDKPTLYADIEGAMRAVTDGVAVCQQRRANDRARIEAARAAAGAPQPTAASYSADDQPDPVETRLSAFGADERKKLAQSGAAMADGSYPIRGADDLDNALRAFGRAPEGKRAALKAHIRKRAKALGLESKLSDSDVFASAAGADQDENTLSLSPLAGSLEDDNHEVQRMPETETPTSVEQLLAQHQAKIDQLEADLAERDVRLSAATQTNESLGGVVHRNTVNDTIKKLQGKVAPGLLLAAREIMLNDDSWKGVPEGGGLNLSVQAPKADGSGSEDRTIQTPTELALFMLSAAPSTGGQTAVDLAAIREGIDDFQLSAHNETNDTPEAREIAAKAAVQEWAQSAHPEWQLGKSQAA